MHLLDKHYETSTINRMLNEVQQLFAAAAKVGRIEQETADALRQVERVNLAPALATEKKEDIVPHTTFRALFKKCGKPSCSACQDEAMVRTGI